MVDEISGLARFGDGFAELDDAAGLDPVFFLRAAHDADRLCRIVGDGEDVDEVIMGNVVSAGIGQAPAKQAAMKGGIPASVSCFAVNKVCGSALKAVALAAQAIWLEEKEIIVSREKVQHFKSWLEE